jgi:hypothetical protein
MGDRPRGTQAARGPPRDPQARPSPPAITVPSRPRRTPHRWVPRPTRLATVSKRSSLMAGPSSISSCDPSIVGRTSAMARVETAHSSHPSPGSELPAALGEPARGTKQAQYVALGGMRGIQGLLIGPRLSCPPNWRKMVTTARATFPAHPSRLVGRCPDARVCWTVSGGRDRFYLFQYS